MKEILKRLFTVGLPVVLLAFSLVFLGCVDEADDGKGKKNGTENNDPEINDPEDNGDDDGKIKIPTGKWIIDPETATTALTGGTTYTGQSGGNQTLYTDGYGHKIGYELWSEQNTDNTSLTWYGENQGGGAAFKATWNNNGNFLGRVGWFFNENKSYKDYGNLYCGYNISEISGSYGGWSYIGIYGWSRNATIASTTDLIEYYIVENSHSGYSFPFVPWDGVRNAPAQEKGSFTVDGAVYKIYTAGRPASAGAIASHNGFTQYFSVRQSRRTVGTISITEHFKKWEALGMEMGSNLHEAKLKVEVGGGAGAFDTKLIQFYKDTAPSSEPAYFANATAMPGVTAFGQAVSISSGVINVDGAGVTDRGGGISIPLTTAQKAASSVTIKYVLVVDEPEAKFIVKQSTQTVTGSNWYSGGVLTDLGTGDARYPTLQEGNVENLVIDMATFDSTNNTSFIHLQYNNGGNQSAKFRLKIISVE
jgi:endo-1,4-beta-xylanase